MAADTNQNGMDGLDGFPNEVLALILELLDLESLLKCSGVCRSWRKCSLWESNYLPHVLDAYTELTHGTRPVPATLSGSEKAQRLKELFRTSVSALPVFAACRTLRDIAAVLHRLDKSWLAGSNTSFASLNHGDVHQMPLLSMAIDAETGSIVTGDSGGTVAFWNVSESRCYHQGRFQSPGLDRVIPKHIAIQGDIMVVASTDGAVVVTRRGRSGGSRPFLPVGEFWPNSQPASIRMEGYVCIVGEIGAVSFWDLSNFANFASFSGMDSDGPAALPLITIDTSNDSALLANSPVYNIFYRDSQLYLGLPGSRIQQMASQSRRGRPVQKQLWEPDEYPYTRLVSGPEYHSQHYTGQSRLCPIGSNGDILVSWADSSIYRLASNTGDELVWEPRSECLIPAVNGPHKDCIGIYARGEQVICRARFNVIEMFLGDGTPIGRIPCDSGNISCIVIDPAFIAVGTREATLCIYYFAPGHPLARGQGLSSSSSAATNSLQSPSLERKHTYKRKYQEAMGMDLDKSTVVGTVMGSGSGLRVTAKNVLRGSSPRLGLESKTSVKIPVPAP